MYYTHTRIHTSTYLHRLTRHIHVDLDSLSDPTKYIIPFTYARLIMFLMGFAPRMMRRMLSLHRPYPCSRLSTCVDSAAPKGSALSDSRSSSAIDRIRNFGIISHVDAGKTTCSERMLFYSGKTRSMGGNHFGTNAHIRKY